MHIYNLNENENLERAKTYFFLYNKQPITNELKTQLSENYLMITACSIKER